MAGSIGIPGRTILFIGSLFFVFLVAFILYKFEDLFLFLPILLISGLSNVLWYKVIQDSRNYPTEKYRIKDTEDRGVLYITYMATYISVLPLVEGGIYGLIGFAVILVTLYLMYINSDMIYYNPFLAIFSYKFFKVTLEGDLEIYLISKQSVFLGQEYKMFKVTDYTYLIS